MFSAHTEITNVHRNNSIPTVGFSKILRRFWFYFCTELRTLTKAFCEARCFFVFSESVSDLAETSEQKMKKHHQPRSGWDAGVHCTSRTLDIYSSRAHKKSKSNSKGLLFLFSGIVLKLILNLFTSTKNKGCATNNRLLNVC